MPELGLETYRPISMTVCCLRWISPQATPDDGFASDRAAERRRPAGEPRNRRGRRYRSGGRCGDGEALEVGSAPATGCQGTLGSARWRSSDLPSDGRPGKSRAAATAPTVNRAARNVKAMASPCTVAAWRLACGALLIR